LSEPVLNVSVFRSKISFLLHAELKRSILRRDRKNTGNVHLKRSIARKIYRQTRSIEGWFSREAMYMFAWLDEIQKTHGITGDIFEIGCHHGKSAMLLGQLPRHVSERFGVCDLFGQQEQNVSRSGCGDLEIFQHNMRSINCQPAVHQCNSSTLTPEQIGSNYRIFHVDGGHNGDEALADLQLASRCLVPGGVILVDDPFRYDWPGVTEAIVEFLQQTPEFRAVLVGCNKLALVRAEASDMYLEQIDSCDAQELAGFAYPWRVKLLPFCGQPLRIAHVPEYRTEWTLTNLLRRVYHLLRSLGRRRKSADGELIAAANSGANG